MTRRVEHIMGTAISVDVAGSDDLDPTFAWFRAVDATFSTYRPDSEISRLDRGELSVRDCSSVVRRVLDDCTHLWHETGGFFDAYATGKLDPSAYVKGWSVQVASDRLAAAGAADHCINAGGDVCVRGNPQPGSRWRVGIQHPWERAKVAWVLEVTDAAIATSGTYERGEHVVDPFSGKGMSELVSVTVVGADLATADAYSTAAMAMGRRALGWLTTLDGYESAVITADGRAYASPGLPVAG